MSVCGTGRPFCSKTRPPTMILSPTGSPACCRVRSQSFASMASFPNEGAVNSVSVCGMYTNGFEGARMTEYVYVRWRWFGLVPGTRGRFKCWYQKTLTHRGCVCSNGRTLGHASSSIRPAGRRPQLYDLARPGPRSDSGVLSSQATTYDFADQRQNGIFARRGAALPLHAFETGICGLRG